MIEISKETALRINVLFDDGERELVAGRLLRECGDNLPLVDSTYVELAERIRFAVLKLSGGDIKKLDAEIKNAAIDWRDTLMAAGFGSDTKAHLAWTPGK